MEKLFSAQVNVFAQYVPKVKQRVKYLRGSGIWDYKLFEMKEITKIVLAKLQGNQSWAMSTNLFYNS